jgi:hypothetical protein
MDGVCSEVGFIFLGCDLMWTGEWLPTFRRIMGVVIQRGERWLVVTFCSTKWKCFL